jgi:chitooligosaccharide deacetylase
MASWLGVIDRFESDSGICLTFDDGPDPNSTIKILGALAKNNVRATFFCIGRRVRKHPDLAREIVLQGHEIGNHTMTHIDLWRARPQTVRSEVIDCQRAIEEICDVHAVTCRAPRGRFRAEMAAGRKLGITSFLRWDTAPNWLESDPLKLSSYITEKARAGSVILLHDGLQLGVSDYGDGISNAVGDGSAASIGLFAPLLKMRGLMFRTVSEQMALARPVFV